jgi:hypothetical protein
MSSNGAIYAIELTSQKQPPVVVHFMISLVVACKVRLQSLKKVLTKPR